MKLSKYAVLMLIALFLCAGCKSGELTRYMGAPTDGPPEGPISETPDVVPPEEGRQPEGDEGDIGEVVEEEPGEETQPDPNNVPISVDVTPPTVIKTEMKEKPVDLWEGPTFFVTFSEEMNLNTITPDDIILTNLSTDPHSDANPTDISKDGNVIAIDFQDKLSSYSTFRLMIKKTVEDMNSNEMEQDYIWTFNIELNEPADVE